MTHAWRLPSALDTEALGVALGLGCPWSERQARIIFLRGELGAGKTTLAAAMLKALGTDEVVRSPTYSLIETYQLSAGVAVHIDLYRLLGIDELEQLGLRDYLIPSTLLLIEWPERAEAGLPSPDLEVQLQICEQGRVCGMAARSDGGELWLSAVRERIPDLI